MEEKTSELLSETKLNNDGVSSQNSKEFSLTILLEYVNNNAGALAILIPVLLAIASVVIKFYFFCFSWGELSVFQIPRSAIELSSENALFDLLFGLVISIFTIVDFYLFALCIKKGNKSRLKNIFLHFIFNFILLFICLLFIALNSKFTKENLIISLIAAIIIYLFIFVIEFIGILLYSFLMHLTTKNNDKINGKKNDKKLINNDFKSKIKILVSAVAVVITIYCLLFYLFGYFNAKDNHTFKFISDNTIVVYETKDKYYIESYILDNKDNTKIIIYNNEFNISPKDNIKITTKSYKKVDISATPSP